MLGLRVAIVQHGSGAINLNLGSLNPRHQFVEMMRYLADTNVVSELRNNRSASRPNAMCGRTALIPPAGAASVITIGEIRKDINLCLMSSSRTDTQASLG